MAACWRPTHDRVAAYRKTVRRRCHPQGHQPEPAGRQRHKIAAEKGDADYSGIIIRKGEPELLEAINKALADIKADGTYQKISDTYFGQDVSK